MARKKIKVPSLNEMRKKFSGFSIASEEDDSKLPWLPSRFLAFNYILGGGIPFGKILELFGTESSGKSLMAYDFAYSCQYLNGVVLWIDAEQSFTNSWAKINGLDLSRVIIYRETAIEKISDWVASMSLYWRSQLVNNEPILLILDSVSALDTETNINSEMSNASADMGNRAKAIYKYFRIRNEMLYSLGVTQIYINQLRTNLKAGMFENPDTTPGGAALKFYASVRLDIRKTENLKQDGEVFGNRVRVKVVKNKVAPPFREAEFDIIYGKGISKSGNILDLGVNLEIVEKSGSWFAYDGTRIGQGRENAKKYFEENPEIMAEVEKKVRAKFNEAFEKSLSDEMEVDAEQETEPTEEE